MTTLSELTLTLGDRSVRFVDLPEASQVYLATYGFKQSIGDSTASPRKTAKDAGKSEAEIERVVADAMAARFDAIVNGTTGLRVRTENPLTAFDREVRKIGMEALTALAKAKGISLRAPKDATDEDKEKLAAARETLYDRLFAAKGDEWKAEAKRRLDAKAAAVADDFDDILAGFTAAPEADEDDEEA